MPENPLASAQLNIYNCRANEYIRASQSTITASIKSNGTSIKEQIHFYAAHTVINPAQLEPKNGILAAQTPSGLSGRSHTLDNRL